MSRWRARRSERAPPAPWLSKRRLPYLLIAARDPLRAAHPRDPAARRASGSRSWAHPVLHPQLDGGAVRRPRQLPRALDFGGPIGAGLLHSFAITAAFTVIVVALSLGVGMLGAAAACNSEFRGQRWFRTLFLVPYAMPVYVAVIAWSFLLDRDNGALNTLLGDLHLIGDEPPFWLIGTNAFWAIVMTTVVAAVAVRLPHDPGRAAEHPQRALRGGRRSTAPHRGGASATSRCRCCARSPGADDHPLPLDLQRVQHGLRALRPRAAPSADLLSLHIYVNSFVNLNFGLGSAMSVLLLVFLLLVTILYMRVFRVGSDRLA